MPPPTGRAMDAVAADSSPSNMAGATAGKARRVAGRLTKEDAQKGEAGHGGGAKHRRLGSGDQDEESNCPDSYGESGPAAESRQAEEAHDGSEEHRQVLSGYRGQVGKPRRPEVCLDPG